MNLGRLARKLRREVVGNPKKAAVLGLLVLVASYFWSPLVWGWFVKKEAPVEASAADADSEFDSTMLADAGAPESSPPEPATTHPWQLVVEWMKQDPSTTTATDLGNRRDPFQPIRPEVADAELESEAQTVESAVTPQSTGLELTGTLVGGQRSVALINGKAYREGGTVASIGDGASIEFELTEVHPRRIVLQRLGEQFELTIPQQARSGRIERIGSAN